MKRTFRPQTLVLFLGDLFFFAFSLYLSLFLRALKLPSSGLFLQHLYAFSFLFVAWIIVFFIAGLYESRFIFFSRRALSAELLTAQGINFMLAALFFFFIPLPIFGIAPKTLLIIYLFVSLALVFFWRAFLFPHMVESKEGALIIGEGQEVDDLERAFLAPNAAARLAAVLRPSAEYLPRTLTQLFEQEKPRLILADTDNPNVMPILPEVYDLIARGATFADSSVFYENLFGRIPLSHIDDRWIARNISRSAHVFYDPLKRAMDIVLSVIVGLCSLVVYPFVALCIAAEGRGDIFISQERIGQGGKIIRLYKFRSMTGNDSGVYAGGSSTLRVTNVGKFLRATRLDELPQLWSVLAGDLSLIGPRPELPALVSQYEAQIPYYRVRHLIKPGLSGWAQLYHDNHPHHGVAVEATREKLSYDLYYLKHRSLMLDLIVALKTVKKILTRSGA